MRDCLRAGRGWTSAGLGGAARPPTKKRSQPKRDRTRNDRGEPHAVHLRCLFGAMLLALAALSAAAVRVSVSVGADHTCALLADGG